MDNLSLSGEISRSSTSSYQNFRCYEDLKQMNAMERKAESESWPDFTTGKVVVHVSLGDEPSTDLTAGTGHTAAQCLCN